MRVRTQVNHSSNRVPADRKGGLSINPLENEQSVGCFLFLGSSAHGMKEGERRQPGGDESWPYPGTAPSVVFQHSSQSSDQWFSLSVVVEQVLIFKKPQIYKESVMKQKSLPGHTLSLGRVNKRLFCVHFQLSFLPFKLHPSYQSPRKHQQGFWHRDKSRAGQDTPHMVRCTSPGA